jgi:hypothetical protein
LALAWLSDARNRLCCRPEYVLFDAWYPSKALLKRIRDSGGSVVCRLKKNRRFNGQPVRAYRRYPYGAAVGWLRGDLKGLMVRHGKQYYATNRLTLLAAEVHRLYRVRSHIEEVMRVCKEPLGLSGCQARSERAQRHHILCGFGALCGLEREGHDCGLSSDKLKRHLSCRGRAAVRPALERLRRTA